MNFFISMAAMAFSLILMLIAICYFMNILSSLYDDLNYRGGDLVKKKLNNCFQKFITIRNNEYYVGGYDLGTYILKKQLLDENYTFLIHYELCICFFISVIFNIISAILFLVLGLYFNAVLRIFTIIVIAITMISYLVIAIIVFIRKRKLV